MIQVVNLRKEELRTKRMCEFPNAPCYQRRNVYHGVKSSCPGKGVYLSFNPTSHLILWVKQYVIGPCGPCR